MGDSAIGRTLNEIKTLKIPWHRSRPLPCATAPCAAGCASAPLADAAGFPKTAAVSGTKRARRLPRRAHPIRIGLWLPKPADFGHPEASSAAPAPRACAGCASASRRSGARRRSWITGTGKSALYACRPVHTMDAATLRPLRIPVRTPAVAATERGRRAPGRAAGSGRRNGGSIGWPKRL